MAEPKVMATIYSMHAGKVAENWHASPPIFACHHLCCLACEFCHCNTLLLMKYWSHYIMCLLRKIDYIDLNRYRVEASKYSRYSKYILYLHTGWDSESWLIIVARANTRCYRRMHMMLSNSWNVLRLASQKPWLKINYVEGYVICLWKH